MNSILSLRELLVSCNLKIVYSTLYYKHTSLAENKVSSQSFDDCISLYRNLIIKLMMLQHKKATMPLYVSYVKESFEGSDESYYQVKFLNPRYERPLTKPYNLNLNKHTKFFSLLGVPWNQFIDASIIVDQSAIDEGVIDEQILVEILWEMTFYGFSEKDQQKTIKTLKTRIKNIQKNSKLKVVK